MKGLFRRCKHGWTRYFCVPEDMGTLGSPHENKRWCGKQKKLWREMKIMKMLWKQTKTTTGEAICGRQVSPEWRFEVKGVGWRKPPEGKMVHSLVGNLKFLWSRCERIWKEWPCNAWIGPKMSMCQKRAECLQKSGFIVPILYTPYNCRFRGPRRPKLGRVALTINTNPFQVILDHSQHFQENVHFCSFCSFWAPGVKRVYFCL